MRTPTPSHAAISLAAILCAAGTAGAIDLVAEWSTGFLEGADARRAAINAGLARLNQVIQGQSNARVVVKAKWLPMGATNSFLAVAEPESFADNFPGQPHADASYPEALANSIENRDRNTKFPEITITFNSDRLWHFGVNDPPNQSDRYDMVSVTIHEVLHGLGFITSLNAGGTRWGQANTVGGKQNIFDRFLRNAAGDPFTGPGQPFVIPDGTTTASVTWGGANAALANGTGRGRPDLFAPPTYQTGSSLAHTDPGKYWGAWGISSPFLKAGARGAFINPVVQGMLMDMGYTGIRTQERFWNGANDNGNWSTAANWWDPQNPAAGKVPQAGEHVVIQQPGLARATDATITLNTAANVGNLTNLSTLAIKNSGALTLSGQGLVNGGVVEVTAGGRFVLASVDNAHNARLQPRFVPSINDPTKYVADPAGTPVIRLSGAGSKIDSSFRVNNSGNINIKDQGRWFAKGLITNGAESYESEIKVEAKGILRSTHDLNNASLGIVNITGRGARTLLYAAETGTVPNGSLTNAGAVELTVGGRFSGKSATNFGTIRVRDGSRTDETASSLFWVESFVNGEDDGDKSRQASLDIIENDDGIVHRATFHAEGKITNHKGSTITTIGKSRIHYGNIDNRGTTEFAPGTPSRRGSGAADAAPLAWGGDFLNHGTAVITGPGQIYTEGSFTNLCLQPTLWHTREATLAFVPSPDGSIQHLRTNSVELTNPTSPWSGGRLYTDRILMGSQPPVVSLAPAAPDDMPDDFTSTTLSLFRSGGIPTLDVAGGVVYLLDHADNGLAQLIAMINAGAARVIDSLNPGRPVFLESDPSGHGVIQLVAGTPGFSGLGFSDNFAFGTLGIYADSHVTLVVPAPGSALFCVVAGIFASRRARSHASR